MAVNLTSEDHDYITRTILGEHGPDAAAEDHAATAHLVLNRMKSDRYADSATDIVLHPGHFPSWGHNSRELLAIKPTSAAYKKVAQVVDRAADGTIPDSSNGSTERQPIKAETIFTPTATQESDPAAIARRYGIPLRPRAKTAPVSSAEATPVPSIPAGTTGDPAADAIAARYGIIGLGGGPTAKGPGLEPAIEGGPPNPEVAKQAASMGLATPVVEATPLLGPAEQIGRAALAAREGKEGSFGERFQRQLNIQAEASKLYGEQNPVSSTVGGIAGSLLGTGAMASTKLGQRALGMVGETTGARSYQGAAGGAGMGVLDALSRGEDPLHGFTTGAVFGGVAPILGEGARVAFGQAAERLWPRPGPMGKLNPQARTWLTGALEGETPASIAAGKQRAGEHGFLADVTPGLTDLAGGIGDLPQGGKVGIREAYRLRAERHGAMLGKALDDAFGPPANLVKLNRFHTEARKAASDPLYQLWRTTEVQPTDKLKSLVPRLEKAGAFDEAERLSGISGEPLEKAQFHGLWMHDPAGPPKYPTTQTWDYVKQGLDSKIEKEFGPNGSKTAAMKLVNLKHELIDEIEKTPAGPVWKEARATFADRSVLIDQIARGRETFFGGRSAMTKHELEDEMERLVGPERAARMQGVRAIIDNTMNETTKGPGSMRERLLAPNNQEKIRILLKDKPGEADRLIERLKSLSFLAEQDVNIRGNLATGASSSMRTARREALEPPPLPPVNFNLAAPGTWIPKTFRPGTIIEGMRQRASEEARSSLAPILTTGAGPTQDDLLFSIQREMQRRAQAERFAAGGSKLFITAGVAGPGAQTARKKLKDTDIPYITPAR